MKNLIIQKSKVSGLPPQQLYGLYAMDQLVSLLSRTKYANYLIAKGGFLLTSVYGLDNRATGDLDFTVRGFELNDKNIIQMIHSLKMYTNDKQYFEVKGINETRENFAYNGYELKLIYHNEGVKIPLNVDLTTGESLIKAPDYNRVQSIFTDDTYDILGYSIEQILSDKFYTLLAYGNIDDSNSRMKDYYDLYLLSKTKTDINFTSVNAGIDLTMKQRSTTIVPGDYSSIIKYLKDSTNQKQLWVKFEENMPYAKGIDFNNVMDQIEIFSKQLIINRQQQSHSFFKHHYLDRNNDR